MEHSISSLPTDNNQDCPFDDNLIYEILTRVSLETLGKCRAVSKEWNSMIYNSWFHQAYSQRRDITSGFVSLQHKSFVFLPNPHSPSCNSSTFKSSLLGDLSVKAVSKLGLLLCQKSDYSKGNWREKYYVCKPSTGQCQQIPNPKTKFYAQYIAMAVLHSNPLHYKILRLSIPKKRCIISGSTTYTTYHCEIFDSDTWAWKRLDDVMFPYGQDFNSFDCVMVLACGSFHIFMTNDQVFAFDMEKEEYVLFDLPKFGLELDGFKGKKLVQYEGKLGLIFYTNKESRYNIELWVVHDYMKNKIWKKIKDISCIENSDHGCPSALVSSDVMLFGGMFEARFYNFVQDKTNVVKANELWACRKIAPFQTDFEPCPSLHPTISSTSVL